MAELARIVRNERTEAYLGIIPVVDKIRETTSIVRSCCEEVIHSANKMPRYAS